MFEPPTSAAADGYQGAIPEDVHAGVPKNNGSDVWAPDIIRMNGQFYLYYAVSSWGSFQSAIGLATNPVLDPKDPAYKWTSRGIVVSSNGNEDLNAIDPGVILAPDGTLWICYGSYHGSIRVTQLDPKTGLALAPGKLGAPVATARESEATDIIFHDGYYYLFVNHDSCCKGKAERVQHPRGTGEGDYGAVSGQAWRGDGRRAEGRCFWRRTTTGSGRDTLGWCRITTRSGRRPGRC